MKLLVLGGDESILVEGSPSQRRVRGYAGLFDEMHIIVAARSGGEAQSSDGLFIYPARGKSVPARIFRMLKTGAAVCKAVRPDVISAENADMFGLVGCWLARRFRVPLQAQVHTDVFSPHYRKASWREWLRCQAAVFVLPRAAGIRAVSKRVAGNIQRRLAIPVSRLTVLPIQTDTTEFAFAPRLPSVDERFRDFGFRMVSTGRFVEREKHFSLLIDVMAGVAGKIPRTLLVIAGDGPDRPAYERRIRDLGLGASVVLEPWRDDLPAFLKSFDLFLLPSNYEGWGRACIEAAAAGLPVVMTDVGLAGDVLVDGVSARVVPVGDDRAMARAVVELARDPDERRRLARAAKEAVRAALYPSMADYHRAYRAAVEACRVGR